MNYDCPFFLNSKMLEKLTDKLKAMEVTYKLVINNTSVTQHEKETIFNGFVELYSRDKQKEICDYIQHLKNLILGERFIDLLTDNPSLGGKICYRLDENDIDIILHGRYLLQLLLK